MTIFLRVKDHTEKLKTTFVLSVTPHYEVKYRIEQTRRDCFTILNQPKFDVFK